MTSKKFVSRNRLIRYLDDYLNVSSIPDDSINGLQVEGAAEISKAVFAVDACLETVRAASDSRANILVVHHGLFWKRNERIVGVMRERISTLLENEISLYASHLPLDCHEEVGNNVQLAEILGLRKTGSFATYKGVTIGVLAKPDKVLRRETLLKKLEQELNTHAEMLPFGPARVKKVGIVSGEAASFVGEAKLADADTLITGETSHAAYHFAKESEINVIFAGHYASETVGLVALLRHIEERFAITCRFLSAPTGY